MIQSTGIIRKIDKLGRVLLPMEARILFGMNEKDGLEVLTDKENGRIILQKAYNTCLGCGATENLKEIRCGYYICSGCVRRLEG